MVVLSSTLSFSITVLFAPKKTQSFNVTFPHTVAERETWLWLPIIAWCSIMDHEFIILLCPSITSAPIMVAGPITLALPNITVESIIAVG